MGVECLRDDDRIFSRTGRNTNGTRSHRVIVNHDLNGNSTRAFGDGVNQEVLAPHAGMEELRLAIRRLAGFRDLGEGAFTARKRHIDALVRAEKHFETGRKALVEARAGEIFAEDGWFEKFSQHKENGI